MNQNPQPTSYQIGTAAEDRLNQRKDQALSALLAYNFIKHGMEAPDPEVLQNHDPLAYGERFCNDG